MKITHRNGDYVNGSSTIKRNGILKVKLKNLEVTSESKHNEYTLSAEGFGEIYDFTDPSATDFYDHEFGILIATKDEVLEICLNAIAPWVLDWDGDFLLTAIVEIPYTIEDIEILDDTSIYEDDLEGAYYLDNTSIMIHNKDATIIRLKADEAY